MGTGMGGSQGQVMALTAYNGDLYAGGFFTIAGGVPANHLAKWNGTSWSAVGSGVSGIVYSLGTYNGNLVIGGLFSAAGGVSANGIALYNGTNFSALGSGCGGGYYPYVFSVVSNGSDLYAGGLYTIAGGLTCNGIARWNGSNWSQLGSGFGYGNACGAYGICVYNSQLIATGIFSSPGANIAAWGALTGINNLTNNTPDKFSLSQNYPNPFNPTTKIKFEIPNNVVIARSGATWQSQNVFLKIFDILGKEVATLVNESLQPGTYEVSFDGSKLNSGTYFYRLQAGDYIETRKMTLVK
jgi:hypothetical protein